MEGWRRQGRFNAMYCVDSSRREIESFKVGVTASRLSAEKLKYKLFLNCDISTKRIDKFDKQRKSKSTQFALRNTYFRPTSTFLHNIFSFLVSPSSSIIHS
jgi:hypothetical protein